MKKSIKIHFASIIIVAMLLGIYSYSNSVEVQSAYAPVRSGAIYRLKSKGVAFECVVNWNSKYVDDIIDIADKNNIGVAFFVSSQWAEQNSKTIDKILKNDKNTIGMLGKAKDNEEFKQELNSFTLQRIDSKIYMPLDKDNADNISYVAKQYDVATFLSSIDVQNRTSKKEDIINRIAKDSFEGAIIRFEPTKVVAMSFQEAIEALDYQNKTVVTLDKII